MGLKIFFIYHSFFCGYITATELHGVCRGVAGPKKLRGTHVTLKNEYENSYRINFLPYTKNNSDRFDCTAL